jgi:hypothetical protein
LEMAGVGFSPAFLFMMGVDLKCPIIFGAEIIFFRNCRVLDIREGVKVLRPVLRCYGKWETGCKIGWGDGGDRAYWWGFGEMERVLWDLITR